MGAAGTSAQGVQATLINAGRRLHLQHGPIDLIIEATGQTGQVSRAYRQASRTFDDVLQTLVNELTNLRLPVGVLVQQAHRFDGPVAQRMMAASRVHAARFVTPMAAVAGAVADYVLAQMVVGLSLERAWVNNGGDIAWHLKDGARLRAAIVDHPGVDQQAIRFGTVEINATDPVRGMATSGWRGRSYSLGIADAVTVLAKDAAAADVAATLIANAVDLPGSSKIKREAASDLQPDSDLGERLVTTDVARLSPDEIASALSPGTELVGHLLARGLIHGAVINLQGVMKIFGEPLSRQASSNQAHLFGAIPTRPEVTCAVC